jgi:hypothetical protein
MNAKSILIKRSTQLSILMVGAVIAFCSASQVRADPISPELQAKVDKAKKKLEGWATNPVVVAAVKESNAKGGIAGMTNAKWDELNENDPVVKATQNSAAGKQCKKWEDEDKGVNKVTIFDDKGNMVASSTKTLLYNAVNRPAISGALKGNMWQAPEVKPDPTTQKKSVNIAAPIKEGGKVIGLINAAVDAQ